jgi:hypothetical protein
LQCPSHRVPPSSNAPAPTGYLGISGLGRMRRRYRRGTRVQASSDTIGRRRSRRLRTARPRPCCLRRLHRPVARGRPAAQQRCEAWTRAVNLILDGGVNSAGCTGAERTSLLRTGRNGSSSRRSTRRYSRRSRQWRVASNCQPDGTDRGLEEWYASIIVSANIWAWHERVRFSSMRGRTKRSRHRTKQPIHTSRG